MGHGTDKKIVVKPKRRKILPDTIIFTSIAKKIDKTAPDIIVPDIEELRLPTPAPTRQDVSTLNTTTALAIMASTAMVSTMPLTILPMITIPSTTMVTTTMPPSVHSVIVNNPQALRNSDDLHPFRYKNSVNSVVDHTTS